jgi:hypothetical protein
MSRSGYMDDIDRWDLIRWRGQVASAIRGKRGQAFLLELWQAMQALPAHKLTRDEFENEYDGTVCALGAVGKARGLDLSKIDIEDYEAVAAAFGIPHQLAQEIMFMNDEAWWRISEEERFARMAKWVAENLKPVEVSE